MLNYLKKYGLSDSAIMILLTLIPYACSLFLLMPMAHISDLKGKKLIGGLGNWIHAIGFGMFAIIYIFPEQALVWAVLAILLFSVGLTCFVSNWFALLHPLIEDHKRGHFFAILRISWQVLCIVATFVVSLIIAKDSSYETYLWIIGIITFFLILRIWYYMKIPDISESPAHKPDFWIGFKECVKNKEYLSFCIFIGVYMFFCSGFLTFVNLYEKESLKFSESQIVTMGYLAQLGALFGYWKGARLADKSKNVLLFRGNLILTIIVLFLFTFVTPSFSVVVAGILTLLFAVAFNSMGIGVTTEAMRLVKEENRSLGISISMVMTAAGASLCGMISAYYLKAASEFKISLGGFTFNHYQCYLLFCSLGLLLLLVIYSLKKHRTI